MSIGVITQQSEANRTYWFNVAAQNERYQQWLQQQALKQWLAAQAALISDIAYSEDNFDWWSFFVINRAIDTPANLIEIVKYYIQRGILWKNFGVFLENNRILNRNGWTTTRVNNVFEAVIKINDKYQQFNLQFRDIFADVILRIDPTHKNYCGSTAGPNSITWYQCTGFNDPYSVDNIIHEFGHILQNRAGRINGFSMSGYWDMIERRSVLQDSIISNPLLGFSTPENRQNSRAQALNPSDRLAEEVADMFLYWIRDYPFADGEDLNGQVGNLRQTFVNGGLLDFPQANGGPLENPGIITWSLQAANFK